MTDPAHRPDHAEPRHKLIDWRLPITWVAGLAIAFCMFIGGWVIRTDNRVNRHEERVESLEKRTMGASEQAYELRNIATQLAEVNKKLTNLHELQSQMTVMEFRMGNAEFALGLGINPGNRKAAKP